MNNAIIFHGAGSSPTSYWHPYIKNKLESLGYKVFVPQLPNANHPDIKEWLPFALDNGNYDEETLLIGHSAGCPLILSVLENIEVKIHKAILVAGLVTSETPSAFLQDSYNWQKIKDSCENFIFINSDIDPWKCDDIQGRIMFDNLGGTLIIRHGEGHMGSETFKQSYKEFPLLTKLIEDF